MSDDSVLRSGGDPNREPFITIDDLIQQARELFRGLRRLSEYKHPLDIRRGITLRKGVKQRMDENRHSRQIKGSGRTYFADIEKTKEGKPYLRITESRKGGEDKWRRKSIHVFPEDAEAFAQAISAMAAELGQE